LALCVPAYNAARFLPRLLKSAAAQAVPFDEILVYDDCSTDDTGAVASALGATVIRGDANVGCSAGKNRLLAVSACDWIHFHDADDELLPHFTTLAARWMELPDAPDVVLFDFEWRDDHTHELLGRSNFCDDELRTDPIRYVILHQVNPFCGLYRRSRLVTVGGYDLDPEILYNEDVAFHCKLALAGFSFRAERDVAIINYRVNGSMSGAHPVKCLEAHVEVMRRVAEKVGARYPVEIASRLWSAAAGLGAHLEWESADRALTIAHRLFRGVPPGQDGIFSTLCSVVSPVVAFRIRETAIRLLKPQLR
jgi:glycosyltransferase involved in cell wall biosynthesis